MRPRAAKPWKPTRTSDAVVGEHAVDRHLVAVALGAERVQQRRADLLVEVERRLARRSGGPAAASSPTSASIASPSRGSCCCLGAGPRAGPRRRTGAGRAGRGRAAARRPALPARPWSRSTAAAGRRGRSGPCALRIDRAPRGPARGCAPTEYPSPRDAAGMRRLRPPARRRSSRAGRPGAPGPDAGLDAVDLRPLPPGSTSRARARSWSVIGALAQAAPGHARHDRA